MDAVKEKEVTKSYYDAHDVSIMLGIGLRKAYYIIADLNSELEKQGCIVIQGKVNKRYFQARWNGKNTE